MKKKTFALLFALCIALCCVGCSDGSADNASSDTDTSSVGSVADDTKTAPEPQETDADDFFGNAIAANPIDALYDKDIEDGTKSFSEIADAYTSMWKGEFAETLKLYKELCADGNEDIIATLEKWRDCEQELWGWELEAVFENSASTYGTQVYYEQLKQVGDRYRDKTVWMKYMCFIMETGLDPSRFADSLRSVSFSSADAGADTGDTNVGNTLPEQYTQVINDYKQTVAGLFADDFEQKVNDGYFTAPDEALSYEWFCMVINAKKGVDNITPDAFGYALCDLDSDNTDELILLREDYYVLAIYTTAERKAQLIGAYSYKNRGIILEDGSVYNAVSESADTFTHNVYRLESGKLSLVKVFGSNSGSYYELSDGEEKPITAAEYDTLNANYPALSDQSRIKEYMSNNGIAFVSLAQ